MPPKDAEDRADLSEIRLGLRGLVLPLDSVLAQGPVEKLCNAVRGTLGDRLDVLVV